MKQLYCLEQIKFPQPLQCEEIEPIVCDKEEWSLNDVFTVNSMRAITYVTGVGTGISDRSRICGYSDM